VTWMASDPPARRWTYSIQNWICAGLCSWSARVSITGGLVLLPPALSVSELEQAEAARATAAGRVHARVSGGRRCMGASPASGPRRQLGGRRAHQGLP